MKIHLLNGKQNKLKAKALGDWGESIAMELLLNSGFKKIKNLNIENNNYPFADIYAERNSQRYVISVKTRLKFERLGGLNSRYNLGDNWQLHAGNAEDQFDATASWLAIQVDKKNFNAYFGLIDLVRENNGIPMIPEATKHYECLADNLIHGLDIKKYTPEYQVMVSV